MKICSKCGIKKPLGEFHQRSDTSDGLAYECKQCRKERDHEYYYRNREECLARKHRYYRNNTEKCKSTAHKWQDENPEEARAAWRRYYRNHKEECQARHRIWWRENRDKSAAYDAKKRTAGWLGSIPVGSHCVSCGATENLERDHIKPIADGGITTLENIQTLCASCNGVKGAFEFDFEAMVK